DSVERENRALANTLLESCDLCVFVTTATRYADLVPWDVLQRIKQREVPLIVVLNRLPPDAADRALVIADTERLFAEHGLLAAGGSGEVIAIGEGEVDAEVRGVSRASVTALRARLARVVSSGRPRLRRLLLFAFRGTPVAPVASVEEGMVSSLEALTLRHASEAARKTAERWSERADAAALIRPTPTLWSASPELAPAVRETLRGWMQAVIDDVRAASGRKHA